ncbi:thiamine-phosphate pyrophosphorylase [Pedobacter sp. BAL39]|uniref:thiamine phosphate synthase n=1 Tax=Pedobacter sp. BAL39 TaxID=391596 RepID=UPI0001559DFD|nr:thiamine phosphate synthase [Pedobacter sp. BAL39]EDM36777.1 thiamine-phosphate pyrophosphorylase [Pedobacter sp. BAL39]
MVDRLHYISQENEKTDHITGILSALNAGVKWIQLRVKNKPQDEVLALAEAANRHCKKFAAHLIINDFPDVARAVSAYGLHLGLNDMSITNARLIVGKEIKIGGTANTFSEVQKRLQAGADYIGLGPFRFTTTKQQLSPILGISGYTKVMNQVRSAGITTPIIAIGGIEISDLPALLKTGIYGVAVSGTLTHSKDPEETVRLMYQQLEKAAFIFPKTTTLC